MAGNGELQNFQAPKGIPIIGQPFLVKAGFVTVMGTCTCRGDETSVLLAGGPAACPSCGRVFVLLHATLDARTGQLQINVGVVARPGEAPPEPHKESS